MYNIIGSGRIIDFTAPAGKFFRRVVFEEIFKLALCSVNSATCQFAHFRQTARFLKKFNCQGSSIYAWDRVAILVSSRGDLLVLPP
jgi:hypothetical protein